MTTSGLPALAVACLRGHVEVARSLLAEGAPVDVRDKRGNSPIHWAAASGMPRNSLSIRELLLEARCYPDAQNGSGQQIDSSGQQVFAAPPAPAATAGIGRKCGQFGIWTEIQCWGGLFDLGQDSLCRVPKEFIPSLGAAKCPPVVF